MAAPNAPIPQPNVPFVSAGGLLTREGYYFLLSLFNRTGGSATPVNLVTLQQQVVSLFVEEAMDDDATPVRSVGLSLADVMSDDVPPVSMAPALLAAWVGDTDASSVNGQTFGPNPGQIGEYITSPASPAAISLTTGTPKTIASILLDAGNWDVYGNIAFAPDVTTTTASAVSAISVVDNTLPTGHVSQGVNRYVSAASAGIGSELPTGTASIRLSAPATVYLVGSATFAVSTMAAYGIISAIRTP